MGDVDCTTELDAMTDQEVMDRVRGIRLLGARRWSEREKMRAFMEIFHPGDPRTEELVLASDRRKPR